MRCSGYLALIAVIAWPFCSWAEGKAAEAVVREPAVAGQFYPASAGPLRRAVEKFLEDAAPPRVDRPVALVVPHAGYIYSGQIAADAYRQASGGEYELVVLLGTNHTASGFRKVALYPGGGFRTPLGVATLDREAAVALKARAPECVDDAQVHAREHSVEVQVPFVQVMFPNATILPLVVGAPDPGLCARLGQALADVLRGRRALLVASSDLSHYPSATDAFDVDRRFLAAVASLDPARVVEAARTEVSRNLPELVTCACGEAPILVAMEAAKGLGATRAAVVSYANSGDAAVGELRRVVGYGSVAFAPGSEQSDTTPFEVRVEADGSGLLPASDRKALLALARETIHRYLTTGTVPLARGFSPKARRSQGVFVTIQKKGHLRGCIGHFTSDRSLPQLVGAMALQAAFRDPRFSPVSLEEFSDLTVEISALTPMKPVASAAEIAVGRDGVLLEKEGRQAVFLPQVATEQGWGRDEMLNQLCRKAGLPAGCWMAGAKLSAFQAEVFREGAEM